MRAFCLAFSLVLLLAACGIKGPSLAGHEGLQFKVLAYYADHAVEGNTMCRAPRIQGITRTEIVEETEERLVVRLRYSWIDTTYGDFDDDDRMWTARCNGFASRTFTIDKTQGYKVVGMSGPSRSMRDFSD